MTDNAYRHSFFDIFARPNPLVSSQLYVDNDTLQKLYRIGNLDWLKLTGHQIVINEEMVKDLKAKVFPTRELKYLDTRDGKREVKVA